MLVFRKCLETIQRFGRLHIKQTLIQNISTCCLRDLSLCIQKKLFPKFAARVSREIFSACFTRETNILKCQSDRSSPSEGFLEKRCSENMQFGHIY